MRRVLLISIIFFISKTTFAQENDCQCDVAFNDLVQKVEDNYIVLAQMRIDGTAKEYDDRVKKYKTESTSIEAKNCTKFLKSFTDYFNDGHLSAIEFPKYSKEQLMANKKKLKASKLSIQSILRTLAYEKNTVEKNGLDGIIGKWTNGSTEMAIIKDGGYYKAYVLNSTVKTLEPGELKFKFQQKESEIIQGTYYTNGYTRQYREGGLYKEATVLSIFGGPTMVKVGSSNQKNGIVNNELETELPTIKKLDDKNTLFTIPSFSVDFKKFISILKKNEKLLRNTENLIFDIRGNTGGNAIYMTYMDLYADQSIKGEVGKVLASKATQKYFERFVKNTPKLYGPVVERIKNNIGKIVDGPDYPNRDYKQSKNSKIKNVAILTDKGCMSASESFIIHSKRYSSKVKTFGGPTRGVIDYTSVNSLKLKGSGKQNIYFAYPTGTLTGEVFPKDGYNKTGIIPDVPIKSKVKDKVQFIIDYYKKRK